MRVLSVAKNDPGVGLGTVDRLPEVGDVRNSIADVTVVGVPVHAQAAISRVSEVAKFGDVTAFRRALHRWRLPYAAGVSRHLARREARMS